MHSLDAHFLANQLERDLTLRRLAETMHLESLDAREPLDPAPPSRRRRAWWSRPLPHATS